MASQMLVLIDQFVNNNFSVNIGTPSAKWYVGIDEVVGCGACTKIVCILHDVQ